MNIASNKMIIPELLQSRCNSQNIFEYVSSYIENPNKIKEQVEKTQSILNQFKSLSSSSKKTSKILLKYL